MARQWIGVLSFLALGCLGAVLAHWQWQRAAQKDHYQLQAQQHVSYGDFILRTRALDFSWEKPEQWLGTRLHVSGHFDPNFIALLDHQTYQGEQGLDVIALLRVDDQQPLLVNLGWVPWASRDSLPQLQLPTETVQISGQLYPFSRPGITLGPYPELKGSSTPNHPARLPWVDERQIEEQLHLELFGAELRVAATHPFSFQPHWQLSVMTPEKHRAYAWQWAGLTLLSWGYALWMLRH